MPDATLEAQPTENAEAAPAGAPAKAEKGRSLWGDAWQNLRRNPLFVISSVLILLMVVMAAFPGLFTDVDPREGDPANHYLGAPQLSHWFQEDWFGYDGQGYSIWSRVVHGARASILVGFGATILVTVLGGLVGLVAGYFGGWLDSVLSRITDIFFGVPFLLGSLVVLNAVTDRTAPIVMGALAFLGWTQMARVMRGSVITTKQSDYVTAARALGAGTWRIMLRHILPNAIAPVLVVATIALGAYISAEATLSYLGIGLQDPTVSWGIDISAAAQKVRIAPHVLFFPAAVLSLCVLAFMMMGDAVRDALDPKLR